MAKYVAVYRCGHSRMVNIYGKDSERDRKLDYLKTIDCPACVKKAEERKREEDTEKAAALAVEEKLPILTGSPKQVRWAILIRQNMIDRLQSLLKDGEEKEHFMNRTVVLKKAFGRLAKKTMVIGSVERLGGIFKEVVQHQLDYIKTETQATYFIEHRDYDSENCSSSADNSLKPCMIQFVARMFDTTDEEVTRVLTDGGWI